MATTKKNYYVVILFELGMRKNVNYGTLRFVKIGKIAVMSVDVVIIELD